MIREIEEEEEMWKRREIREANAAKQTSEGTKKEPEPESQDANKEQTKKPMFF